MMVADFVAGFAKLIASYPEEIRVESFDGDEVTEIVLYANQEEELTRCAFLFCKLAM